MDFLSPPMSSFPNNVKLLHVGNEEHHHYHAREEEKRRRRRTDDDTTTITITANDDDDDAEKVVMKMIKKALVLISEKICDDNKGGQSDAVARLGAYLSVGKNSNIVMKGGSKVQFLLSKMQPTRERRWIPSAKNLLRLKCLNEEKEIEKESDKEDTILYLEWKSAFYEQLWMEERTLREKMSSSSSSKSSSSFVVGGSKRSDEKSLSSPDGPLLREGYARTPSTAGKTSEKTMNSVDEELEECDYREWNRITRSPVLKNTRACAATHSNRSSVDDGNLVLPISNLLETLVLEEKEEGEEEEEELREEGVITPRPTNDKNNLGDEDDDENFQFTFRTPEQSNKNKKDPQHLTPPGAPLRVRNSFRRVEEEEEGGGGGGGGAGRAQFGTWNADFCTNFECGEEQAPRRSLF